MQTSPVQTPLVQSVAATLHAAPSAHGLFDVGPPQSTPVSSPFLTPSVCVGTAHALLVQTPLVQSVGAMHALPAPHRAAPAVSPPQSMSVSLPSFLPSAPVALPPSFAVMGVSVPVPSPEDEEQATKAKSESVEAMTEA